MATAYQSIDLNGEWSLRFGPQVSGAPTRPEHLASCGWPTISAAVPGNVELDLARAGRLPADLHRANNIYQLRDWEYYRWFFRRTFSSPEVAPGERVCLVFGGIDCIAEVFLNGESLGTCRNMLIEHRFDITDKLRAGGENELIVRIDSSVLEGRRHRPDALEFAMELNWESLAIRKAPHMYGWDIMPRVVSAGLWRGVQLEILPATRLEDVYWATLQVDPQNRAAEILVTWHVATDVHRIDTWKAGISLHRDGVCRHRSEYAILGTQGRFKVQLQEVDLWYPRGSGEQALYDAVIHLFDADGAVLAEHHTSLGIRKVQLDRTDLTDEKGGQFQFIVNGRRIYCRGTNHVPLDALHSRDAQHLPEVLPMLLDLNCNMIRCWGGNVYEDHAFFDFCDQHGIMVWQDFAMACAIYPQTPEFMAEIREEAQCIIRKLRNHCSLVLWAGNNENDQCYGPWSGLNLDPNTDTISRQLLPEVVRRLDPLRDYLPSSPYYSPELHRCGDLHAHAPEDHLWGPRDDFKGPFYTSSNAHFVSEIGYHGCPDIQTMRDIMDPEHLWPWQNNDQWLTHAVRPHPAFTGCDYRIPLMANQIRVLFESDPQTLEDFILASQISQAEADKYFIERWRMGKWRRTGMLWWNLRDGWPVISDAVVDYFGRRKLAYEYIKRVQADVCVSIAEPQDGYHNIFVMNDTMAEHRLDITLRDADSGRVCLETRATTPADSSTAVGKIAAADKPALWLIEWTGGNLSGQNHYLAGPRPFRLEDYRRWLKTLLKEPR